MILRENSAADIARGAKPLEVDGLAKPIAARVMSLARGGQTLLTAEARDELGDTALKVESHGHWLIKGVADPIELFESRRRPTLASSPPADGEKVFRVVRVGDWWMPVKRDPEQPAAAGRRRSSAASANSTKSRPARTRSRLLTLLGMGGLGKTRLSNCRSRPNQIHQFPDGVWFLDLAPISDAALVVSEAAQVLGVREEPDRPLLQTRVRAPEDAPHC